MNRPPSKTATLVHVVTVPESLGFLVGQPTYMSQRGFAVYAVSSPGDAVTRFEAAEGISVIKIAMSRSITPGADLISLCKLLQWLRRLKPDVVHAHTPKASLLAMIAAAVLRTPVRIYHVHGLPVLTARGVKRRILTLSERITCFFATDILCVSRSVREEVFRLGLSGKKAVTVLGDGSINGIDAKERFAPERWGQAGQKIRSQYSIPSDAIVFGFVGRVVKEKGIVELAQAWRVIGSDTRAHLFLVGPYEEHDPVPDSIREQFLADPRVHVHGADWDTARLYAAMDVLVLPSYREGFPVVPLEAAAMSLPVIATRVPGCVDAVVDGVTGKLVAPRDSGSLAEAMASYLRDPLMREVHGRAGRVRALAKFNRERLWAATHELYLDAIAKSRKSLRRKATGD